jgi:hypothetical protein
VSVSVDQSRIEKAVREILVAIGEDPDRDGLLRTPQRVAAMYAEIFSGLDDDPSRHLTVKFEADHDEMVMTAASRVCRSWRGSSTGTPAGPSSRSASPRRSPTRSSRCSSRPACS